MALGHTILSRASGPDLLLLEEPVGSLLKDERKSRQARHHGSRFAADPAQSAARSAGTESVA